MKILEEKYPMGSFPYQKSAGKFINENLYSNLDIMSKAIVNDMTFLSFVYSSTLEVGAGKSVFTSQVGECWTYLMKKNHNIEVPFDIRNCVFKPEDLIKRSFELPKYSFIWLDEWEDLHYMSKLGFTLRQFFRKCRQLNLFMVCIIPDYFQLPIGYAISRSVCAIDVRYGKNFERGYFHFYNFDSKRDLYRKGKKTYNYRAVRSDFNGSFGQGMGIDEEEYKKMKYQDLIEQKETEKEFRKEYIIKIKEKHPEISVKDLSEVAKVSQVTIYAWLKEGGVDF